MKIFKQTVGEVQLNYKPTQIQKVQIRSSSEAWKYLLTIWSDKIEFIEEFYIILLNRANNSIGFFKLSEGGTSGTVVDEKLLFQAAIISNACSLILAHNHPSGNLKPSAADSNITKKLKTIGDFHSIKILDHVIVTKEGYFSFADEGLL